MPQFEALDGDIQTDVLIIGGGMAGLLCAWQLQKAGIDCVVAEANRIAGGVTVGTTAKLTSQHGLIYHKLANRFGIGGAGLYLQAQEESLRELQMLCKNTDCDYREESHNMYSLRSRKLLEQELTVLQKLQFPAEFVEEPKLPFPTLGAVRFLHQGRFHPRKLLACLTPALQIYENTPVRQLTKTGAVTDHGTIRSEKIIVATHFPFLNKHGSYFMKLYQQRSYVLCLENAGINGMYLDEQENGLSFRSQGESLLLGGCGHRTGKSGGGWRPLESFAREYYPGSEITHRWATQDCMTLDGMPYVGQYSACTPNLYVATGFNKWGMTGAMTAARILTDTLLGKETAAGKLFSPSRSMLTPQLAVNLLESTANLLTPTTPRCPHLGCALKWNPQEHSWDCSCHGSRFTEDGRLLNNPATGDLKKRR